MNSTVICICNATNDTQWRDSPKKKIRKKKVIPKTGGPNYSFPSRLAWMGKIYGIDQKRRSGGFPGSKEQDGGT